MKETFFAASTKCSLNCDQMTKKPIPIEIQHRVAVGFISFLVWGQGPVPSYLRKTR